MKSNLIKKMMGIKLLREILDGYVVLFLLDLVLDLLCSKVSGICLRTYSFVIVSLGMGSYVLCKL